MQFTMKFQEEQTNAPTKKRSETKRIAARPTQKKSYAEEVKSGRIKGRKADILRLLKDGGALSCRDAAMILDTFPNCLTAAFKQLEESAIIAVVGEKTDKTSGKTVMVYGLATW